MIIRTVWGPGSNEGPMFTQGPNNLGFDGLGLWKVIAGTSGFEL